MRQVVLSTHAIPVSFSLTCDLIFVVYVFYSEEIDTVRKENVFSEEVTDADMDIIQKRVALQQRQFAEFEKRDKARKYQKIKAIYDYLTSEEVDEMLKDCSNDEV